MVVDCILAKTTSLTTNMGELVIQLNTWAKPWSISYEKTGAAEFIAV